jgi:glyoxylase-like metal-dependent hydrolase (beta-lactamase superfamily II)
MDKVTIPEEDVVALESIAPGLVGLRVLIVNVYAISESPSKWILVDTGLPLSGHRIRSWAESHFGKGSRPEYILLTHGHFDHTGAVVELAQEWDVPVYVHSLEVPFVTDQSAYPPPDPFVGGGVMALLSKLYPRGPVDLGNRVKIVPADGSIPEFNDWRWIHTPGHTVGHISLFRERDRTMIVGDAFVTTKQESFLAVATQRPELHGPPAYYTTDWDAARESVERLAALRPLAVATGHGKPLSGEDVPERLSALASNFDRVARPAHGRYVDDPAA